MKSIVIFLNVIKRNQPYDLKTKQHCTDLLNNRPVPDI